MPSNAFPMYTHATHILVSIYPTIVFFPPLCLLYLLCIHLAILSLALVLAPLTMYVALITSGRMKCARKIYSTIYGHIHRVAPKPRILGGVCESIRRNEKNSKENKAQLHQLSTQVVKCTSPVLMSLGNQDLRDPSDDRKDTSWE